MRCGGRKTCLRVQTGNYKSAVCLLPDSPCGVGGVDTVSSSDALSPGLNPATSENTNSLPVYPKSQKLPEELGALLDLWIE